MKNATMETIHNQLQQLIANQVTKDYFVGVINKLTSRIQAQEEQIKDLKERVNQLESNPNTTSTDSIYNEIHEQEIRKSNAIILGMPEETGTNRKVIFQKECNKVQKLLSDLEITNNAIIMQLMRIGTKEGTYDTNKPQPLRIILENNII